MIRAIATALGISVWQLVIVAIGLTALAGAAVRTVETLRDQGRREVLKKIEDANNEAEKRAREGQKSVDDCYLSGGIWDRRHGVCKH